MNQTRQKLDKDKNKFKKYLYWIIFVFTETFFLRF